MYNENIEMPKRYIGTKTLKAWPRTLGEYNTYRGWQVPENENPADAGYMVEYEGESRSNMDGHEGYVSWSPANVFEAAYREIDPAEETWQGRLKVEGRELSERLMKLREFIASDAYTLLPASDRDLITDQAGFMAGYLHILAERNFRAEKSRPPALDPADDAPELTDEAIESATYDPGSDESISDPPGGGTPNDE